MKYSTIQTRIKDITAVTDKNDLIKDAIQWGLDTIATSWNFPYLMQESFITTVAPYETGEASITNGSTAVAGSGTTFTATMVGRKIRFNGEEAYYRIASFTSTTSITLEQAYQGTTDTDATFSIFKDEYRLPANLDRLKVMRQIEDSVAQIGISASAFDILEPTPNIEGSPNFNIVVGSKRDTYTTGTVEATNNSSTITGTGTSWTSVDGLGKGTKLTIGTSVFTVKSVDSALQITIFEKTTSTIAATTSYSLLMDNLIIQFFEIPDAVENIYFRYQRQPEILYNDEDIPDLPDNFHFLLIDAGCSRAWETKDKEEARAKKAEFFAGIQEMKRRVGYISESVVYPRASMEQREPPLGFRTTANRGRPISL